MRIADTAPLTSMLRGRHGHIPRQHEGLIMPNTYRNRPEQKDAQPCLHTSATS